MRELLYNWAKESHIVLGKKVIGMPLPEMSNAKVNSLMLTSGWIAKTLQLNVVKIVAANRITGLVN